MGRVVNMMDQGGLDPSDELAATGIAAWLDERELVAISKEEYATLNDYWIELQAIHDGLHSHGIKILQTVIDGATVYAPALVAPRSPLDAPDLPPPFRGLRLAVYAAIACLIAVSNAHVNLHQMNEWDTEG